MAQASHEDRGPLMTRVTIAVYAVAILFVALRFFTRGWLLRKFGLDDLFIGIALLLGAGETATMIMQVRNGRDRHSSSPKAEHLNMMVRYNNVSMLLYYVANWSVKMSVLALYRRICSLHKELPWFLRGLVVWIMSAVITALMISFFLVELFGCTPISAIWSVAKFEGRCITWMTFYTSQAAVNVAVESVLILFPVPLLAILKIDKKQRCALILIFSLGLIPLITTMLRLCFIAMAAPKEKGIDPYGDTSWTWSWIPLWSQIEVQVGIIAASLPSLSPLLKQAWWGFTFPRSLSSSQIRTLAKADVKNRSGELHLHELPSTSTLEAKSVSSTGKLNISRPASSCDSNSSEEDEVDCEAFPYPYGSTQIGVAKTVNTRLSRAVFVEMPASPRRSFYPSRVEAGGIPVIYVTDHE